MESSHELPSSSSDELLALLVDERWYDVVLMEGRYFYLNSLDSITADKADLSVAALLRLSWSELQGNQPFDSGLEIPITWVG